MLITRQGRLVIIILVAAGCRSANVNAQPAAEAYSYTEYVVHDSLVIDSLAKRVNTDSLYRLNRLMLDEGSDVLSLSRLALCEKTRLVRRNGIRPTALALQRMTDTLWRPNEKERARRIPERAPRIAFLEASERTCGPFGPRAPESVSGVSLFDAPSPARWKNQPPKPHQH